MNVFFFCHSEQSEESRMGIHFKTREYLSHSERSEESSEMTQRGLALSNWILHFVQNDKRKLKAHHERCDLRFLSSLGMTSQRLLNANKLLRSSFNPALAIS
jgi:hypothetical protein